MSMNYHLSAVETVKILGYSDISGRKWLEKLKQDNNIELPQVYCEFMELMADSYLLSTSDLWTGKMAHGECTPYTFYSYLQDMIEDYEEMWSKNPSKWERSLYELSNMPKQDWPKVGEDYLIIGSDYAGGMGTFGIRMKDLNEVDPPVYVQTESDKNSVFYWEK